ncbi:hypothetical protein HQ587_06130 [bacterium]|nr:hypothetical protein [bacterium]
MPDTDTDLDKDPVVVPDLGEGIIVDDPNVDPDDIDPDADLDKDSDKDPKVDAVSKDDFDKLQSSFDSLQASLKSLEGDKKSLNKALHEARQKNKAAKKEEPLSEDQLLKILEEADGDAQTIMNVVKYQAEQAAKKSTGEAVTDADTKKKAKEAKGILSKMYPSLDDESSEMRKAVDETKSDYGLGSHPLGDFFATGIEVLNALPDLISAAEQRGKDAALKGKADGKRKESIKDGLSHGKGKQKTSATGLSSSQSETANQLGLSASQLKTYKKIVGSSASIQVKE